MNLNIYLEKLSIIFFSTKKSLFHYILRKFQHQKKLIYSYCFNSGLTQQKLADLNYFPEAIISDSDSTGSGSPFFLIDL